MKIDWIFLLLLPFIQIVLGNLEALPGGVTFGLKYKEMDSLYEKFDLRKIYQQEIRSAFEAKRETVQFQELSEAIDEKHKDKHKYKQEENIRIEQIDEDSFIFEVQRAFDSFIWQGEFTMKSLAKQDSKWSASFVNIPEVVTFIEYSVQQPNFTFQISISNKAIFVFEIDFGFKKKKLNLMIEPKAKDTKETLNDHAQILRTLTEERNSGFLQETAEAVKNLTKKMTQIENTPPPIAFHKIFRLKKGNWEYSGTQFLDFSNANGEFNLSYPAYIKWELQMHGCWQSTKVCEGNYQNLRLKLAGEKELFSPDAEGITFRAEGKDSGQNHNEFFSDVMELNPGKYNVQLQISRSSSDDWFKWNSPYGEISLLFIVYPRVK